MTFSENVVVDFFTNGVKNGKGVVCVFGDSVNRGKADLCARSGAKLVESAKRSNAQRSIEKKRPDETSFI